MYFTFPSLTLIIASAMFFIIVIKATADEIKIPFSCYPKILQSKLEEKGYKLDLSGNDRTEESWGFLENKGTSFSIFTYQPVTEEELQMISGVVNGSK